MRICTFPLSIYSILTVSSLTEIQYLLIEPSGKGTHTNQSLMFKIFYLYGFVRWTKCIWSAIENNYLLVYKLFKFAIRNKAEIIFSSEIFSIIVIADKKIMSEFCVSGTLCSPPHSAVQIKCFLQLRSIISWNPQR